MTIFAPPPPYASSTTFNFSKAVVLTVDRNSVCLDVMSQILSGFGFRRFHRCSDIEGVEDIVRTRNLDLILIDPYGFDKRAYDFIRWLRNERIGSNSSVPVVVVTSQTDVDRIKLATESGADFVVAKPFAPIVLLDRILWVAKGEGRGGFMATPSALMTPAGS